MTLPREHKQRSGHCPRAVTHSSPTTLGLQSAPGLGGSPSWCQWTSPDWRCLSSPELTLLIFCPLLLPLACRVPWCIFAGRCLFPVLDLINTVRLKLGTTACENGAGASLQQSGAERCVRDAALSKCRKIEQNGNDFPRSGLPRRCGGAASVRGNGSGSGKTPTVFRIRDNDKELLNWGMRPKVWNSRIYWCFHVTHRSCALMSLPIMPLEQPHPCIRKHHPMGTSQDTECDDTLGTNSARGLSDRFESP